MDECNIEEIHALIQRMRRLAEELKEKAGGIQAVERNLDRILANIKMLELNISDVQELV
jgi:predicted component of type VI protein secretion system